MLVIEGSARKSLKVIELVNNMEDSKNILIFDLESTLVKMYSLDKEVLYVPVEENIHTDLAVKIMIDKLFNDNKEFAESLDLIVFYLNTSDYMIDLFKELEEQYGYKSILTVQTNNELKSYEV